MSWTPCQMCPQQVFSGVPLWRPHTCAGTPCSATRVTLHMSRYTFRSRSPQNPGVFQVQQWYRSTTHPLKGPVAAPVALQLPGVSHVKLPLKRCRATEGGSSYTCGCRATLCNYVWSCRQQMHCVVCGFGSLCLCFA